MSEPLRDIAAFHSVRFHPFLPEDSQVNPGVYGAELAFWLAERLTGHGVVTSYPEYEDWGWYILYLSASGSEFAVHCSNTRDEGDAWQLHLCRHARKMFGRDRPPFSEARPLIAAIRKALDDEPTITNLEWLYPDGDE